MLDATQNCAAATGPRPSSERTRPVIDTEQLSDVERLHRRMKGLENEFRWHDVDRRPPAGSPPEELGAHSGRLGAIVADMLDVQIDLARLDEQSAG